MREEISLTIIVARDLDKGKSNPRVQPIRMKVVPIDARRKLVQIQ